MSASLSTVARRSFRNFATSVILPSKRSLDFIKTHFPTTTEKEWNDWNWHMRHGIRSLRSISKYLVLQDVEERAIQNAAKRGFLPMSITPYYLSLLHPTDSTQPLRKTVIPVMDETLVTETEKDDPLGEDAHAVVPGLIHRYPDRVLFLATKICSTYCRYCTRSRLVGESGQNYNLARDKWAAALAYIENHREVRDVLISGGDPLTMSDESLQTLLTALRNIDHVEFIRIGTKIPAVMPQRITPNLLHILRDSQSADRKPVWLSLNFAHLDEVTDECRAACNILADAGIPLGSQTVLMRGINDSSEQLKSLFHALLKCRVRPYYLYQMDHVRGSSHFRTPVQTGLDIMKDLAGHTTGYAVPSYVIDAPGGGGKIRLLPNNVVHAHQGRYTLVNYENKQYCYDEN